MKTLNLTQHSATPDQIEADIVDLPPAQKTELAKLLTFDDLPSQEEIMNRCDSIGALVEEHAKNNEFGQVMLGGAPFLMPALQSRMSGLGMAPVYAFSKRESVDVPQPDGTVRKSAVFKHAGLVTGPDVYFGEPY